MGDTFEQTRASVARHAAKDFAGHVLTQVGPGEWHCGTPGTGNHSFNVIVRPRVVLFWGDTGDWILEHSDRDSLGWLRRAAADSREYDYLLRKVRRPEKEFYPGDVIAWLRQQVTEDDPKIEEALAEVQEEGSDLTHHRWCEIAHEAGFDDAYSIGLDPSPGMLWLAEALSWFVKNLPAEKTEEVARG